MIAQNLIPAVSYIRMSTESQKESPDQQRAEIAKLAEREGYRVLREYCDLGISGDATEKRVGFNRMRDDAGARGDFRAVLCWDQSRFGRFDMMDAGYWIKPFRDARVSLVTVDGLKTNWNDLTSQLIYSVNQSGKHQFLHDLSRNVLRGVIRSAERGNWRTLRRPTASTACFSTPPATSSADLKKKRRSRGPGLDDHACLV